MGKGGNDGKTTKGNKGGKGKGKASTQAVGSRFAGKEYEEAIDELVANTALQLSDFDLWTAKLLDSLHFSGHAEDAIAEMQKYLTDRTREQIKNPRAYIFTLLTKFKKEMQTPTKPDKPKSDLNADAPEFVMGSPMPQSFSGFRTDAAEFVMPGVTSNASTTPELGPKSVPYNTPQKEVYPGQATHNGMVDMNLSGSTFGKPTMLQFGY